MLQEEEDAAEFAAGLAGDLFLYAPEHVLAGQYLFDEWDPQLVSASRTAVVLLLCCRCAAAVLPLAVSS